MKRRIMACAAVLSSLATGSAVGQNKNEQRLLALFDRPVDALVSYISVEGDSLDPSLTVSTKGVTSLTSKGLLASTTSENSWLRGFVNKKTGAIDVQIYHRFSYGGTGFDRFERASYETPSGAEQTAVSEIGSDVSCGRYGCTHFADIIIPLPLAVIKNAADAYSPSSPRTGLKYRIYGQSGRNVDEIIPANEIAAFYTVIVRESEIITRKRDK